MKKNLVCRPNHMPYMRELTNTNRQVQKYLSLESHPRQKQDRVSSLNYAPSVVALMF